jgi:hypothetical protein
MSNLRVTAASAICALLGLNPTIAQAGLCTADITQFEAAIRQSAGNPFSGLTARQSVNAQLGRQPTPESLHQVNERLKSQFSAAIRRQRLLRSNSVGLLGGGAERLPFWQMCSVMER